MAKGIVCLMKYYGGASKMVTMIKYLRNSTKCDSMLEGMAGSGVLTINLCRGFAGQVKMIEFNHGVACIHKMIAGADTYREFVNRITEHEVFMESEFDIIKKQRDGGWEGMTEMEVATANYFLIDNSRDGASQSWSKRDTVTNYSKRKKRLLSIHDYYKNIDVTEGDVFHYLETYLIKENYFIILDPPFLKSLRRAFGQYGKNEWSDEMHKKLLTMLCSSNVKAKVILFGFESELYTTCFTEAASEWKQIILKLQLNSSNSLMDGGKKLQRKSFWINFMPDQNAQNHMKELRTLKHLTPENMEQNLKEDRQFLEELQRDKVKMKNKE